MKTFFGCIDKVLDYRNYSYLIYLKLFSPRDFVGINNLQIRYFINLPFTGGRSECGSYWTDVSPGRSSRFHHLWNLVGPHKKLQVSFGFFCQMWEIEPEKKHRNYCEHSKKCRDENNSCLHFQKWWKKWETIFLIVERMCFERCWYDVLLLLMAWFKRVMAQKSLKITAKNIFQGKISPVSPFKTTICVASGRQQYSSISCLCVEWRRSPVRCI